MQCSLVSSGKLEFKRVNSLRGAGGLELTLGGAPHSAVQSQQGGRGLFSFAGQQVQVEGVASVARAPGQVLYCTSGTVLHHTAGTVWVTHSQVLPLLGSLLYLSVTDRV